MDIILSGSSGFLGKHIYKELAHENQIITIARAKSMINVNLAIDVPNLPQVDLVIHCAGKAHSVPKTVSEKQSFFDVNFNGTENLLKGLKKLSTLPKALVFISTVAVYGRKSGRLINEDSPLEARDPYGLSKIQAEELVQDWCVENDVICSILRLPLLVGDNPPGNLGAMIQGLKKGYYFNVGGGKARKSMVLASDVAKMIPVVAIVGGIYNLTDGYHPSFSELSEIISKKLHKGRPKNFPIFLVKIVAVICDLFGNIAPINSSKLIKITTDLTFDDQKAVHTLGWNPTPVLKAIEIK